VQWNQKVWKRSIDEFPEFLEPLVAELGRSERREGAALYVQGLLMPGERKSIEPLAEKWRAFGWRVVEVDGHDVDALATAFASRSDGAKPLAVIARTEITGRVRAIPPSTDTHFVKLDIALEIAIIRELEAALA